MIWKHEKVVIDFWAFGIGLQRRVRADYGSGSSTTNAGLKDLLSPG